MKIVYILGKSPIYYSTIYSMLIANKKGKSTIRNSIDCLMSESVLDSYVKEYNLDKNLLESFGELDNIDEKNSSSSIQKLRGIIILSLKNIRSDAEKEFHDLSVNCADIILAYQDHDTKEEVTEQLKNTSNNSRQNCSCCAIS